MARLQRSLKEPYTPCFLEWLSLRVCCKYSCHTLQKFVSRYIGRTQNLLTFYCSFSAGVLRYFTLQAPALSALSCLSE